MLLQNYFIKMNLKEKFIGYSTQELITIIEPNSDYTHNAKTIAIDIIKSRDKKNEINIINEASKYWRDFIKSELKSIILNKTLPKSHFLNDQQMKEILKDAFDELKEKQALFGIYVTKYWAVPF